MRTEELLKDYRRGVEKIARESYLQAIALKHEIQNNGLNIEDQQAILLHCIGLLTGRDSKKPNTNAPQKNAPPA